MAIEPADRWHYAKSALAAFMKYRFRLWWRLAHAKTPSSAHVRLPTAGTPSAGAIGCHLVPHGVVLALVPAPRSAQGSKMKEVRLCWTEGTSPPGPDNQHCGPWMVKSEASLAVLETMRLAGCEAFGPGSHWLVERGVWPARSRPMAVRTRHA
jgi:hypothetical protein